MADILTKFVYSGDKEECERLRGLAAKQMILLRDSMKPMGIKQAATPLIELADGSSIRCVSSFGLNTVFINVPVKPVVVEEEEIEGVQLDDEYVLVMVTNTFFRYKPVEDLLEVLEDYPIPHSESDDYGRIFAVSGFDKKLKNIIWRGTRYHDIYSSGQKTAWMDLLNAGGVSILRTHQIAGRYYDEAATIHTVLDWLASTEWLQDSSELKVTEYTAASSNNELASDYRSITKYVYRINELGTELTTDVSEGYTHNWTIAQIAAFQAEYASTFCSGNSSGYIAGTVFDPVDRQWHRLNGRTTLESTTGGEYQYVLSKGDDWWLITWWDKLISAYKTETHTWRSVLGFYGRTLTYATSDRITGEYHQVYNDPDLTETTTIGRDVNGSGQLVGIQYWPFPAYLATYQSYAASMPSQDRYLWSQSSSSRMEILSLSTRICSSSMASQLWSAAVSLYTSFDYCPYVSEPCNQQMTVNVTIPVDDLVTFTDYVLLESSSSSSDYGYPVVSLAAGRHTKLTSLITFNYAEGRLSTEVHLATREKDGGSFGGWQTITSRLDALLVEKSSSIDQLKAIYLLH